MLPHVHSPFSSKENHGCDFLEGGDQLLSQPRSLPRLLPRRASGTLARQVAQGRKLWLGFNHLSTNPILVCVRPPTPFIVFHSSTLFFQDILPRY